MTAIRIAKGGGIPATQHIMQNADKLTKLASYGKYGGYILGGVGLTAGCVQTANEDNQQISFLWWMSWALFDSYWYY